MNDWFPVLTLFIGMGVGWAIAMAAVLTQGRRGR